MKKRLVSSIVRECQNMTMSKCIFDSIQGGNTMQIENGHEQYSEQVRNFAERWSAAMEQIAMDKTYRALAEFLTGDAFAEECRFLGFEMDSGYSFDKLYGENFFWRKEEPLESLFAQVYDLKALGNEIFSRWSYLNHWATEAPSEYHTEWFKAAFHRLKELAG